MRVLLRECDRIPDGYGIAWMDCFTNCAVAYRIPLNFIARWWHGLSLWVRYGGRPHQVERDLGAAYDRGRRDSLEFVRRLETLLQGNENLLAAIDVLLKGTPRS